jgi:DNA adenine methylase
MNKNSELGNRTGPNPVPVKPFLRWAGGKRRLADLIIDAFPASFDSTANNYFEPFLGGGAIVFALGDSKRNFCIPGKNLYLNDSNPDLITTYKVVKNNVGALTKRLSRLSLDTSKEAYEKIRASKPQDDVSKAARFIYLNKTCFNGLWRVNSKGDFNVPWGKLKKPNIYDEDHLLACSKRLKGSHLTRGDFTKSLEKAKQGDIVYFDPPYIPLTASANFSKYSKDDFSIQDHERLAELIIKLKKRGVHVMLSNSDTPLSREIFGQVLTLRQISVNRSIAADGSSRKPVMEVLGTSFPVPREAQLSHCNKVSGSKR